MQYDIPTSGNTAAATQRAATITAPDITGSGGFAVSSTSGTAFVAFSNITSTIEGAITGLDYLQFAINIPSGTVVSLSDLNVAFRSEVATTVANLSLFATLGSFTTAPAPASSLGVFSTSSNTAGNNQTVTIADPTFQNLTNTTVTFRLYGYDVDDASGSFLRIDNLTLNGTVTVPEPSSLLIACAAMSLAFRRRRA